MNNQPKQRTASERLTDLENALMSLYNGVNTLSNDVMIIKEAIKLLGNKADAMAKASIRGQQMTDDVISGLMVENNMEELKQKVTNFVSQGILKSSDKVTEESFVVGRELDSEGNVANPRLQFLVSALSENVKNKLPGAQAGQVLDLEEGKMKFEVLEVYSVQVPQTEEIKEATEPQLVVTQEAQSEQPAV